MLLLWQNIQKYGVFHYKYKTLFVLINVSNKIIFLTEKTSQ